jgi:DNA-binding GntR family transcriptional regulator
MQLPNSKRRSKKQATAGSLAQQAYLRLEEMIVRLELEPGLALSEGALSRLVRIGRTPVREAIRLLEREGLLAVSPRRGIHVTEIKVDAQLRLLEVRRGLERLMASRAARLATLQQRSKFTELAASMRAAAQTADDRKFLRLDRAFNERVASVAANEFAAAAISLTAGLSRRFWYRFHQTLADLPRTAELHADVAAAVGRGRSAEAESASDRLIDYIEKFTRDAFDGAV